MTIPIPLRFLLFFFLLPIAGWSQEAPEIRELNLDTVAPGAVRRYWLQVADDGMGRPVAIPVLVARGKEAGPVLGLVAGIHGEELNGIPIIQQVFDSLDPRQLRGTVVGVPGINPVSLQREQRRFLDEEDLNRVFPGGSSGASSEQYVYGLFQKLIRQFDLLIDMHTASFGRVNALYVRADLERDTLARLASWQEADVILHSRGPSAGAAGAGGRTLRTEAELAGIPTITIEYGDPQVYQPEMIGRGVQGIRNALEGLKMVPGAPQPAAAAPVYCRKSYWIYTDAGGLLEVLPGVAQRVEKGEKIAVLRNPFGDVLREYFAPEAGVVIGKSTNPVSPTGARILHLGIPRP